MIVHYDFILGCKLAYQKLVAVVMDKLRLYCISLCAEQEDNDDGYRIIREEGEYDGERNDKGQRHGRGRYLFSNGDSYDGEWKRDKMHGFGEYKSVSGEV